MYPGSFQLILNGSVPGQEKMFYVHRCSIWQVPLYVYLAHANPTSFNINAYFYYIRSVPVCITTWKQNID